MLPYYMGDIFGRFSENRKQNLEFSKLYLTEFLKLVDHYGLIDEKNKKIWKDNEENPKYEIGREDKIVQFKELKELEKKIKNIVMIKEEKDKREVLEV